MTWLFCLTLYPTSCYTSVMWVCVLVTFPLHAVNRSDYNPLREKVVTLRACETMACENIGIINDRTAEKIESFTVTLGRTPSLDSRISLIDVEGLVIINDDDGKLMNRNIISICIIMYVTITHRGCGGPAETYIPGSRGCWSGTSVYLSS